MPATLEVKEWVLTLVHEGKNETYTTGYATQEARAQGMREIMIRVLERQGSGGDDLYAAIMSGDPVDSIVEWENETGEYLCKDDMELFEIKSTMEVMRESIESE